MYESVEQALIDMLMAINDYSRKAITKRLGEIDTDHASCDALLRLGSIITESHLNLDRLQTAIREGSI